MIYFGIYKKRTTGCGKSAIRIPVALVYLLMCTLLSSCALIEKHEVSSRTKTSQPPVAITGKDAPLPRVTILLSDDKPAYAGIADALVAQLPEKPTVISLEGRLPSGDEAMEKLTATGNKHVVAIGSLAAQAAKPYKEGLVVFCQVFNYQALGLTSDNMLGVSMVPPAELQFQAWKEINPDLRRVGVITGSHHERLIKEANRALQKYGIDLIHSAVGSDKEMLYTFKRMTPDIQGLWLLPDDRVLSHRVLKETMSYGAKHNLQVVVFHPQLLQLGAVMSVGSVDSDVAKQILSAIKGSSSGARSSANELLPLTEIFIEVNPITASGAQKPPRETRLEVNVR